MHKLLQKMLLTVAILLLLAGCRKKAFDEYYGRPDSLEPPIYQQLESKGNFKYLLTAINKAGYKNILGAAGYWTFFAPHDSAFQVYFAANGINGMEQLDSNTCQQIVTYCLVYNAFKKERIGDYQSTTGWVANQAFRRRTANYTGVYNTLDTSGKPIKAIAANRNSAYQDADNNNKYIPYFISNYMTSRNLTATDYNYFYPTTTYTGFNVADAIVTEQDIPAENGVIHVVNKVITALPSIDQYLSSKPEYSLFKSLFDKFLIQYVLNTSVTTRYQNQTGQGDQVFTKLYSPLIAFSPNNENFLKAQDNDAQQNCWSIFVPTNDVLENYINTVFLEHYDKLENMPRGVIYDFINAHLWQNAVWPSKFQTTFNFVNEEARFDPATDITDRKVLSNGIFYGTKKVQEANVFSSVYGKAYLDPQYSMMITLLNMELKGQVSNIHRNYTLFMISNQMFNDAGYTVDLTASNDVNDQWRYTPKPGSTIPASTGSSTRARLQRIINQHVVPNLVANDLSGEGMLMTYGGEYISYKNNTVFAAGNVDSANVSTINDSKTAKNGRVYYTSRLLEFSDAAVGKHIEAIGTPAASPYNYFWQFLKGNPLWNNTTKEILGVANGTFYTLFIPDNAAIQKAVDDGLLPGTGTAPGKTPVFTPTLPADQLKVTKFIQYHFLNKRCIGADGIESGPMETLFKTDEGGVTTLFVNNGPASIQLTDMNGRNATVISGRSSFLSNRCVIHLSNNYLQYID
jgi:uncharacterized surface protein with fasciclin (FAS1) repeats